MTGQVHFGCRSVAAWRIDHRFG